MILTQCQIVFSANDIPRIGGGDPSVDLLEDYGYEYSPRRRGDPES